MIRVVLAAIFISVFSLATAQEIEVMSDSISVKSEPEQPDTVLIKSYAKRFNPRKALLYSAVLPGMGQVYNNKYWKVPLVYGGLLGGIYVIDLYQDQYLLYKGELFTLLNKGAPEAETAPSGYNQKQLRTIINRTRRQRDYVSILTCIWYVLQLVDAHVDAHLKEFELNPEMRVRLEPMVESDQMVGRNGGISLKIKF